MSYQDAQYEATTLKDRRAHTSNDRLSSRLASFLALGMRVLQQVAPPSSWSAVVALSFLGKTYQARPLRFIRSPWPQ